MKKVILVTAICALCTQAHSQWSLTGNNGTNASTNFIGTKDNEAFKIRTNNTVRMTVSSGGKVGIGTASPQSKLDVAGTITGYDSYFGYRFPISAGTSGASYSSVGYGLTFTDTTANYRYRINNDYSSMLSFRSGGFDFNTAPIGTAGNVISYTTTMAILQNGNVGIGTTTPAYKLSVAGTLNANYLYVSRAIVGAPAATIENTAVTSLSDGLYIKAGFNQTGFGGYFIKFTRPDGTACGNIHQAAGNGCNYNSTSDKRLKNIIGETQKGLSDLMKIKIYDYTFKSDPNKTVLTGFMAQELYDVFPQSVTKPRDENAPAEKDPWTVDYGSVTPLIIRSVQEQQQEIDELKVHNENLQSTVGNWQNENRALKSRLDKLEAAFSQCCSNFESGKSTTQLPNYPITELPKLEQNIPNPFNEQTVIHFYIPASAKSVVIQITDAGNKQLKSFTISERGASQISISAGTLAAGVYTYQLVVDGKTMDAKKMTLTK